MRTKKPEDKDIRRSPESNDQPNTPAFTPLQLERYQFSDDLIYIFKKVLKYDPRSFYQISTNELKEACENQLRRLQQIKAKDKHAKNRNIDNQLSVIVIVNHIRSLIDSRHEGEELLRKFGSPSSKKGHSDYDQSKQNFSARRQEQVAAQIDKNEAEIAKFMATQIANRQRIDFAFCYRFFVSQAIKIQKQGSQKLLFCQAALIQTIMFFIAEAIRRWQPQRTRQIDIQEEQYNLISEAGGKDENGESSEETLPTEQINKYSRYSSRFLEDKMIELSGICQQIPQLQIFNRTLQFSQLQSREKVAFFRVVDVLISLHHRVSYLSRNKPQLLKQLQIAQQQILFINECCLKFIEQIDQQMPDIFPMVFEGFDQAKKSQLTESFIDLKHFLIKLSEIIISQDQFHTLNFQTVNRLVNVVTLYSKVVFADSQSAGQWQDLVNTLQHQKQGPPVSNQQYNLIMLLEKCLQEQRARINSLIAQQGDHGSISRTNEELEDQVNKLIEDYERLKADNKVLVDSFQELNKLKEQLLIEIEERDNMIKNLSGVKLVLEKKLINQQNASNHSRQREDSVKKQEYEAQKYLQSSLLLKEQLRISEAERQKLQQTLEMEKEKYLKAHEIAIKIKPQKERLQIQIQQLKDRIQSIKNDHLRQLNRLNKQINDLSSEKSLLQTELQNASKNQTKLKEKLEVADKKVADYNYRLMLKSDNKDDQSLIRMEFDIQKLRKQLQATKLRLSLEEKQSLELKNQNNDLKIKFRELRTPFHQQDERDSLIQQMKNRINKLGTKTDDLVRQNHELGHKVQELQSKNNSNNKRIKQLQNRQKYLEHQKRQLERDVEDRNIKIQDLDKQIDQIKARIQRDFKINREQINKKQEQISDKTILLQSLERKVRSLEQALARKNQQAQQSTQQLIKVKMQHYQTTIQSHKIIQLKLEEQARSLKKNLDQKIETQIKLNLEVDKLSKEIDRMQELLEKYMREVTEKQKIIKIYKQKNQEHLRIVREYEAEDNARKHVQEQNKKKRPIFTPFNHQPKPEEETAYAQGGSAYTTPGRGFSYSKQINGHQFRQQDNYHYNTLNRIHKQVQTSINDRSEAQSRSGIKYDPYFDVKEYERLFNEYSDFKATVNLKMDELQRMLEQSLHQKAIMLQKIKIYEQKTAKQSISHVRSDSQQISTLKRQLMEAQKDKSDLANQLVSSYAERDLLVKKIKDHQDKIYSLERKNTALQHEVYKLQNKSHRSKDKVSEVQSLARQLKNVKDQLTAARQKSEKQKQNLQKLGDASRSSNQERQSLARQLRNISQQKQSLIRELKRVQQEAGSLQLACATLEREKINLQNTIEAHKSSILQRQSMSKQLASLKNQLYSSQQKYIVIEKEKEIFQKQIIQLQRNTPTPSLYLQQIRSKYEQSQRINAQLIHRNEDLQHYLQAQTQKMFQHYEKQMQRVISERDKAHTGLLQEITNLKQQLHIIQSQKKEITPQDKQKLSIWDERQRHISELKLQKNTLQQDQQQYIKQIQRLGIENQNLRQKNQQIFRQYQNVKLEINKQADYIVRQQFSKKQRQWRQKTDELNNHIAMLVRQRDTLRGQYDSLNYRLEEQTNRALSFQTQLHQLRELDRSINRGPNINLQFYLDKIRALEEAIEAIGEQLNDSKAAKLRQEQHRIAEHQIMSAPLYQQLKLENDKFRLDLQQTIVAQGQWARKQKLYLQELQSMSREMITLKQAMYKGRLAQKPKVTTLPLDSRPLNSTYNENNMQEQLKRGFLSQESSSKLLNQITYILDITRRWETSYFLDSLQRWSVPTVLCQQVQDLRKNFVSLCECTNMLRQEYSRSYSLLMNNPSMQNLIEYVVRILSYFSEIEIKSPESAVIRRQLQNMSRTYSGGLFFTVLEEYTIHILDNNAIEEYKRQLRAKAKELLQIKQKLDELISLKIQQEESMLNRPLKSRRRELNLVPYRETPIVHLNPAGNSPQRTK